MLSALFENFTDRTLVRPVPVAGAPVASFARRRWASLGALTDTPELDWLGWDAWVRTEPPRLKRIVVPF